MRRFLIKMYDGIEHPDVRIALLEALDKIGQGFCCECSFGCAAVGVLGIADLEDKLIEGLLLLAAIDVLVVIFNAAVFAFLLGVVFRERLVKQFMVHRLYVFTHKCNIVFNA